MTNKFLVKVMNGVCNELNYKLGDKSGGLIYKYTNDTNLLALLFKNSNNDQDAEKNSKYSSYHMSQKIWNFQEYFPTFVIYFYQKIQI